MGETLIGFVSGIVSGIGMGGGTILILCLSVFLNVEQHIAQGANIIFFIPTSIAAIIINIKKKKIDLKLTWIISIAGIVGAVIGTILAKNIEVKLLKKLFGFFLAIISIHEIYVIFKKYKKKK